MKDEVIPHYGEDHNDTEVMTDDQQRKRDNNKKSS
jgi:hypothetical protein